MKLEYQLEFGIRWMIPVLFFAISGLILQNINMFHSWIPFLIGGIIYGHIFGIKLVRRTKNEK